MYAVRQKLDEMAIKEQNGQLTADEKRSAAYKVCLVLLLLLQSI